MNNKNDLLFRPISMMITLLMVFGLLLQAVSPVFAQDETPPEIQPTPELTEAPTGATFVEEQSAETTATDQTSLGDVSQALVETVEVLASGDPYLDRAGIRYMFYTDCSAVFQDATHICTASSTPVQAAIDFAIAGEVVTVEAGGYNENVTISKSLTITGTGMGATVLSITLNSDINNATSNFTAPVVFVNPGGSIQDAINLVQNAGTVQVSAGTYTENLDISHPMQLLGPNYGINGTGTRVAEAILQPADLSGSYGNALNGSAVYVHSANVLIGGFLIDGTNGASNGTTQALVYQPEGDNFFFTDNIIQNFWDVVGGDFGLMSVNWDGTGAIDSMAFNNYFHNGYRAIYTGWNNYAYLYDNTIEGTRVGMQIENNHLASPTDWGEPSIQGNTITTDRYGIWYNLHYQSASAYYIENNTIYGTTPTPGRPSYGIYVTSIQNNVAAYVNNNNVTDTTYGIGTWNTPSNLVAITGGRYIGNEVGISVDNGSYWADRGQAPGENPGIVHATNVVVINPSVAGFQVVDNPNATGTNHSVSLFVNSDSRANSELPQSMVICSPSIGRTSGNHASLSVSNTGLISVVDIAGTGNVTTSNNTIMGDADDDFDCIPDVIDNCPTVSNFDQLDSNQNGVGDACEQSSPNGGGNAQTPAVGGFQIIPVTGGMTELSCQLPAVLILPSGDRVTFNVPMCGFSAGLTQDEERVLPDALPEGSNFETAFTLSVVQGSQAVSLLPTGATGLISFLIPEGADPSEYAILFWDPTAEQGSGAWVELPTQEQVIVNGGALPLKENDPRLILSGVHLVNYGTETRVEATVNFTGTFVVVSR